MRDFTSEPHSAIVGENQGTILNLVDGRAIEARGVMVEMTRQRADALLEDVRKLTMPAHHDVRAMDVDLKRLGAVMAVAHDRELRDFASLLLVEGLGPRTLQSLALVAEVIHGAPVRFSDPARFAFAHGGKDGHPFPVPLKTYDETLYVLRRSLEAARIGNQEKIDGFRSLDRLRRAVEARLDPATDFDAVLAREREISSSVGGRVVTRNARKKQPQQFTFPFPDTIGR